MTTTTLSRLSLFVLLATAACSKTVPTPEPEVAAPSECAAPDEAGCLTCCVQSEDADYCEQRTWTGDAEAIAEPWYNNRKALNGACPADCPPCASCSKRQAQELAALVVPAECDCTQPPEIDACFAPNSCGCLCDRLNRLEAACLDVKH